MQFLILILVPSVIIVAANLAITSEKIITPTQMFVDNKKDMLSIPIYLPMS